MSTSTAVISERPRQRQLPLPWALARAVRAPVFAHPAEAELARILTFYRVRWLYEPTNFVLSVGPDGRPTESFTPDFYLPDQRLYLELTTMRQALVTRKNRKLRRLRELYPSVRIRLLYRRDVQQLLGAYEEEWRAPANGRVGEALVTSAQVAERVSHLAQEIDEWIPAANGLTGRGVEVIGLSPGALLVQQQVLEELRARGIDAGADRVSVTRFRTEGGESRVRLVSGPIRPFAGKDVLVVADVVSTGLSLAYVVGWLRRRGARRVEVCAFFNRANARLIDLPVRFSGFEAPNEPLIGCGIGMKAAHRRLPFVATLLPALEDASGYERPFDYAATGRTAEGRATIARDGDHNNSLAS
jgi:hypoxanthine phosphoribosyltransferase